MPIDRALISEWLRLTRNAPPGPWKIEGGDGKPWYIRDANGALVAGEFALGRESAEFIRASRDAVRALLIERGELISLLKEIGKSTQIRGSCLACGPLKPDGHAPTCPLEPFLREDQT